MTATTDRPTSVLGGDITADMLCALDPVAFSQRAGIEPDPWQARLLHSTAPRIVLNASRQSGKSTTTASLALHTALYEPGSLSLVLSPSQRQSGELFRKVLDVLRTLDLAAPPTAESALRLELPNGSRIVALPGKEATIRGFSGVRLILVDEASRIDDALIHAVSPMLAVSGGRLVMLSTPWGKRGVFYETWEHGGPAWERYRVPATDCPRISAEFLESERRSLGRLWFASEYLTEFVDPVDAAFREEDIQAAFNPAATEAAWLWDGITTSEDCVMNTLTYDPTAGFRIGVDVASTNDFPAVAVVAPVEYPLLMENGVPERDCNRSAHEMGRRGCAEGYCVDRTDWTHHVHTIRRLPRGRALRATGVVVVRVGEGGQQPPCGPP